jgi:hypothetical protein
MTLWLPGSTNYAAYRVDRAVSAYDERLMFGLNEDTGDWCVFVRMPSPQEPFPLLGFQSIPEPDDVMVMVKEAHLVRNKEKIWKEIIDSQEKYRAELKYKGDQASEESAEVVEHFLRQNGKSPVVKSLPKGVSASDD